MKHAIAALLFLTIAMGCKPDDRTIKVHASDAEMNAAIARARSTLDSFWALYSSPRNGESDFALKVKITDPNGVEHFWCTQLRRENGQIFGTINNDPDIVKSVKDGQEIAIKPDDISDWLYMRGGKMYGNFTVRPLFKSMTAEELKRMKELLAEP